jgi:ubiquinone/menaquinone biosynthesis C-methylase UbiE
VEKSKVKDSDKEKILHYENVKKFFRKSAAEKKYFYDLQSDKNVERELKKRSMWKVYTLILEEILQSDSNISNAIDVACGMGNFTRELSKHNEFKKIIGIDFLKETFNIARKTKKKFENIYFLQGNLLNLPFKDRSFDLTVCLNTLHHIHKNDFLEAIDELSRVTKNYLMIEIRNKNYFLFALKNKIILQKIYRDLPIYCHSISKLNNITEKYGFNLKIVRGKNLFSWASWRLVLVYKRK